MTRTGTTYHPNGITRHWVITETRPNVFEIRVDGELHAVGGARVVRRFLANN
jgi:hypothetical protein